MPMIPMIPPMRPLLMILWLAATPTAFAQDGAALDFDGDDDCVFVPYDPSFPTETFTCAAWIKTPLAGQGNRAIVGRGEDDDSYNFAWQLYLNGAGEIRLTLENQNEQNFCYPYSCMGGQKVCEVGELFVADDEWHHVAATRNAAGDLLLYIDGQSVATCDDTGVPSSNNAQFLTIGCTHFFIGPPPGGEEPTDWFFAGVIDNPAVWSVALSGAEVADVYANGVESRASGLVAHWKFDEGAGQVVEDASPFANHGFRGESEGEDDADPAWIELTAACPEDLDGSGAVDVGDILAVLAAWGPCGEPCPQDLDGDDIVGFGDVLAVIAAWGPCP